jgi:hypothetical protein
MALNVRSVSMSVGAARTPTTTTKINRHRPRDTKRHRNTVVCLMGSDDELLLLCWSGGTYGASSFSVILQCVFSGGEKCK